MKKKIQRLNVFLCLFLTIILLAGCSQRAKDILAGNLSGKGSEKENTKKPVMMDPEKIRKMGETYEQWNTVDLEGNQKLFYTYSLNQAELFDNPEAAGLKEQDLVDTDYYPPFTENEVVVLKKEEAMDRKVLMCDITFTDMEEEIPHIGKFFLVYETPENEMKNVGYPIYFSEHLEEPGGQKYYQYHLSPGETMNCRLAWSIDEKLLNGTPIYFASNFEGEDGDRQYIPIELK